MMFICEECGEEYDYDEPADSVIECDFCGCNMVAVEE